MYSYETIDLLQVVRIILFFCDQGKGGKRAVTELIGFLFLLWSQTSNKIDWRDSSLICALSSRAFFHIFKGFIILKETEEQGLQNNIF
jgi:hypothetical protein